MLAIEPGVGVEDNAARGGGVEHAVDDDAMKVQVRPADPAPRTYRDDQGKRGSGARFPRTSNIPSMNAADRPFPLAHSEMGYARLEI